MKIRTGCIFILFCLTWLPLSYADGGALKVSTRAWPTKVTVGDEIKLTIKVERPRGYSITSPSPRTHIPPFEIKNVEVSLYNETAQFVTQTFLIKITVFQLGDLQVPPMAIQYKDAYGRSGEAWTEPVKIKVASVIKGSKEKADIRPIKGPISLDTRMIRSLALLLIALFLSVILVVKIVLRCRHKIPLDPESLKPAHERALLELGRLESKELLKEGKVKEHYSELADILRRYLDRRFQLATFEQTTIETVKNLKDKDFDAALTEKIKELLEQSDLVKFAKYIPPRTAADQMTALLKDVAEKTTPQKEETDKK